MKSFLTYVAQDIIQKYGNNLSDIAIVFPQQACLAVSQRAVGTSGFPSFVEPHLYHHQRPLSSAHYAEGG